MILVVPSHFLTGYIRCRKQGENLKYVFKIINNFEEYLIVIMMAYMTIMNFLNVAFRYVASTSFSFTEELTVTVFVWVTMLGIAVGFKRNAHLGMSFFVDKFQGKAKAVLVLLSGVMSFVFMAILLVYGIEMVQGQAEMGSTTPVLGMPQTVQGLSIPVGAFFVLIHIIEANYVELKKILNAKAEGGADK